MYPSITLTLFEYALGPDELVELVVLVELVELVELVVLVVLVEACNVVGVSSPPPPPPPQAVAMKITSIRFNFLIVRIYTF